MPQALVLMLALVANYRALRWIPLQGSKRLWARFVKAGQLPNRQRLYRLERGISPPNTPPFNSPIPPLKSPPLALQNPSAMEPSRPPTIAYTSVHTNAHIN